MNSVSIKTLVLGLSLLSAGALTAQTRNRLADPQTTIRAGNGWAVDPANGALSLAVPVAMVPGEIPIPAGFYVAGMHSVEQQITWTSEVIWNQPTIWYSDSSNLHRPILGTMHFGYISNASTVDGASDSATFALEDGTTYKQEDWVPFTTYNSTFTLPPEFRLATIAVANVKVSNSQTHAQYQTTAAGLGTTINTIVQSVLPVGHAAPTQFYVVLDKDRARIFGFLSGLNAWAPLVWLDRCGHQATFKWTMKTTGLPSGVTALHSVVVNNQRAGQAQRGIQVQWANWASGNVEQDLLRADFIGVDAPSLLVRGFPGQATTGPVSLSYDPATYADVVMNAAVAGMVGRPTLVKTGFSGSITGPSWAGYAGAPPAITPVGTTSANPSLRIWNLVYDGNKAAITDITDPMGVLTHFDYGTDTFPYPYIQNVHPAHGPLWKHGVNAATSTDSQKDPVSLTFPQLNRTWARGAVVNKTWTTTYQEWWPSVGPADKKVELGFGSTTSAIQYANAKVALQRVVSVPGGVELSKSIYTNGTTGLDSSRSVTTFIEVSASGAATYRLGYGYTAGQLTQTTRYAGPGGGTDTPLEQTTIVYDTQKDKLDTFRPTSVSVTRRDGAGNSLAPMQLTLTEFFSTTRLPQRTYANGSGDGTIGQTFTFDSEGRLYTQANFASFSADGVATTTMTYGANGFPENASTSYSRPANQSGASFVSQSSTYDTAGRALTQVDALGVTTTVQYDTLGRPVSRSRQGDLDTTFTYPDPRTSTITQNTRTITELTDGFGRLVRRTLPDGRKVELTYDAAGRATIQKEFNIGGGSNRYAETKFDVLGRPTSVRSPGASTQTVTYTASADLKQSIATTNLVGISTSRKEYRNVLGQVVKTEEPTGGVSTMVYDGTGNLKSVTTTDPSGNVQTRSFYRNLLGLLTSKTEPETGTQSFSSFNALGKPTVVSEAVGTGDLRTRTIQYDGLGRICKVSSSPGSDTVETIFAGAFRSSTNTGGTNPVSMTFAYKTAAEGSRLASETTTLAGVLYTSGYAYQTSGWLDTLTYPNGRVVGYSYDLDGRVTGIQDRTGGGSTTIVSSITTDDWGQRNRISFGSGAFSDWTTQDSGTHLNLWTIGGFAAGGLSDSANPRSHTYDSAERLTKAGEWQNLLHDGANRLAHVESPALGVTAVELNHDAFGNNYSQQMSGTSSSSFNGYNLGAMPTNKISGGTTGWVPNYRGEATSLNQGTSTAQTLGLVWDALGRVQKVNTNFSTSQSYTYAPTGLRIRVQDTANSDNNRRYAYTSGGLLLSEYTESAWKRDVVYLGAKAIAEIDAAGIHELHADHLGTPRIITNRATGQIEGKQAFGPYGESLPGQAAGYRPLTGYTGHLQTDPSGLIYMRGRFYSPSWHRFVNSDQGADPSSPNQMAYVGGGPMMRVDPSGMFSAKFMHDEGLFLFGKLPDFSIDGLPASSSLVNSLVGAASLFGNMGSTASTMLGFAMSQSMMNSAQDSRGANLIAGSVTQPGLRVEAQGSGWARVSHTENVGLEAGNMDAALALAPWQALAQSYLRNANGDANKAWIAAYKGRKGKPDDGPDRQAEHYLYAYMRVQENPIEVIFMPTFVVGWSTFKGINSILGSPCGIHSKPSFGEIEAGWRGTIDSLFDL